MNITDILKGKKEVTIQKDTNKLWVNGKEGCVLKIDGLEKLRMNRMVKGFVYIEGDIILMTITNDSGDYKFNLEKDELLIVPSYFENIDKLPEIKITGYNNVNPDMKECEGLFKRTNEQVIVEILKLPASLEDKKVAGAGVEETSEPVKITHISF